MRRFALAIGLTTFIIVPAYAQQPPTQIPSIIEPSDQTDLLTYLNDSVPDRYANPIRNWLASLQTRAQQAAAARAKPPIQPPPQPPPQPPVKQSVPVPGTPPRPVAPPTK